MIKYFFVFYLQEIVDKGVSIFMPSQVAQGCAEGPSPSLQGGGGRHRKKMGLGGYLTWIYWVSVPKAEEQRGFVRWGL